MKVFLKVLEKLKKQPMCNNPVESDLICKYNKGWNDAIAKVEELISSYNISDMWIPVDVKLPAESGYYMACIYNEIQEKSYCRSEWFSINNNYYGEMVWIDLKSYEKVIAWMPLPEVYKEKKHE